MKTSILEQNEIDIGVVELVQRLVDMISWPARRQAMADVTNTLLDGKPRVAEDVFGWGRTAVVLGMRRNIRSWWWIYGRSWIRRVKRKRVCERHFLT